MYDLHKQIIFCQPIYIYIYIYINLPEPKLFAVPALKEVKKKSVGNHNILRTLLVPIYDELHDGPAARVKQHQVCGEFYLDVHREQTLVHHLCWSCFPLMYSRNR